MLLLVGGCVVEVDDDDEDDLLLVSGLFGSLLRRCPFWMLVATTQLEALRVFIVVGPEFVVAVGVVAAAAVVLLFVA